jgi:hypothetical protein
LSTCYDFFETFSADPALAPFKSSVDAALLCSMACWKHAKPADSRQMNSHCQQLQHCCSTPLDPVTTAPFELVALALADIVRKLKLDVEEKDGAPDHSARVAKQVLQREVTSLKEGYARFCQEGRVPRDATALQRDAAAAARLKADEFQMEMVHVAQLVQRIAAEEKTAGASGKAALTREQRKIVSPEGACVLLDVFSAHYGKLDRMPKSYWLLVLLGMDATHLERRAYPELKRQGVTFDHRFWQHLFLLKQKWRADSRH